MTLVRAQFEIGDVVKFSPDHNLMSEIAYTLGEVTRLPRTEAATHVEVKMLVNGKRYCLMKDHLSVVRRKTSAGPPFVKLLRQITFVTAAQDVICPLGRCLRVFMEDEERVYVEIEEGGGSASIEKSDRRVTWATQKDLVNEPEYNDYRSH